MHDLSTCVWFDVHDHLEGLRAAGAQQLKLSGSEAVAHDHEAITTVHPADFFGIIVRREDFEPLDAIVQG